jgi:hypothetical protein
MKSCNQTIFITADIEHSFVGNLIGTGKQIPQFRKNYLVAGIS